MLRRTQATGVVLGCLRSVSAARAGARWTAGAASSGIHSGVLRAPRLRRVPFSVPPSPPLLPADERRQPLQQRRVGLAHRTPAPADPVPRGSRGRWRSRACGRWRPSARSLETRMASRRSGGHHVDAVLRAVVHVVVEPQRAGGGAARPGDDEHARQVESLLHEPALRLALNGFAVGVRALGDEERPPSGAAASSRGRARRPPSTVGFNVVQKFSVAQICIANRLAAALDLVEGPGRPPSDSPPARGRRSRATLSGCPASDRRLRRETAASRTPETRTANPPARRPCRSRGASSV